MEHPPTRTLDGWDAFATSRNNLNERYEMFFREHKRRTNVLLACMLVFAVVLSTGAASSNPRTRLQGQVPIEDQESGRSLRPYSDNMRLVGQSDINNRGMNGNLGWLDDCAYVAAYFGADHPLAGLAIVDASNPRKPVVSDILTGTPGTRESQVEANSARRLVVVMPFSADTPFGDPAGPSMLQIYEAAAADCTDLTLMGEYDFGDIVTHEHRISEDGNTVYATVSSPTAEGDALQIVDISDTSNPTLLTTWDLSHEPGRPELNGIHDLDVNADGTRAYLNYRYVEDDDTRFDGLAIVDTTAVTERQPDPAIPLIGEFTWRPPETFGGSHSAQLANIQGRTYIIAQDETFNTVGCPWGWARIIDITDEANPLQISTIRLEVSMRRHCDVTTRDNAMYSTHYLGVDNVDNTSLVFFTWYSSGLRVFDIRDPYKPVEVGSYIPGANPETEFRDDRMTRLGNWNVPFAYSFVRYRPETGHIWFTDVYNGLLIVELTRGLDDDKDESKKGKKDKDKDKAKKGKGKGKDKARGSRGKGRGWPGRYGRPWWW